MADKIKIHTGRLGADAGRIQGYINNIAKEMANMEQSVTAMEAMWEGAGRDAFHQTFREDMEVVRDALAGLRGIYEYDMNAKKQYEQCDRKVAAMIAEIKV